METGRYVAGASLVPFDEATVDYVLFSTLGPGQTAAVGIPDGIMNRSRFASINLSRRSISHPPTCLPVDAQRPHGPHAIERLTLA